MKVVSLALTMCACGSFAPTTATPSNPPLQTAPEGWIDETGLYHSGRMPIVLRFPGDGSKLESGREDGRTWVIGGADGLIAVLIWYQQDESPTAESLDDYLTKVAAAGGFTVSDVGPRTVSGADLARGARIELPSKLRGEIWVAGTEPWIVEVQVYATGDSPRAVEVGPTLASFAFTPGK